METKNRVAVISILVALVALIIIILSTAYLISSLTSEKAKIDNLINPLNGANTGSGANQNTFNVYGGGSSSNDNSNTDENPSMGNLPDITLNFGQVYTLDLDSYVSDDEDSDSELDFDVIYTATVSPAPITIAISSSSHIMTVTEVNGAWTGVQGVTIRVTDTDDNTDSDSFSVTITNGSSGNNSDTPVISNIPDVAFGEDGTDSTIDLDNFVTDRYHTDAQITWLYAGNSNINVNINGITHIITFTATANWNGAEFITLRATDPLGNYAENVILVTVTPVEDPTIWNALTNRAINEDSATGTVVYPGVVLQVSDADSPTPVIVTSANTHFTLSIVGTNLVLNTLQANWHGSEMVVLSSNGVTASFILTVNQLMDDCSTEYSWGGKEYTLCD